MNRAIERLREEFHFRVIDPAVRLCASGRCVSVSDGHSLYRDIDHLSAFGAIYLQGLLSPIFEAGHASRLDAGSRAGSGSESSGKRDPSKG